MEKSEARVVAKANKPVNPFTWKSDSKDINKRDNALWWARDYWTFWFICRGTCRYTLCLDLVLSQNCIRNLLIIFLTDVIISSISPFILSFLMGITFSRHCGHLIFHQLHLQTLLWLVNIWCCLLTFEWLAPVVYLASQSMCHLSFPLSFSYFYVCLASYLMQTFHGYLRREKQMEIWGEAKRSSSGISPWGSKFTKCCSDAQPSDRLWKRPNTCNMPDTESSETTQPSPSLSVYRSILIGAFHRI